MVTILLEILLLLPSVSVRMMLVCTLALMIMVMLQMKIVNTLIVMMPVQMIHAQERREAQSTE
jgi:hypothetical protein